MNVTYQLYTPWPSGVANPDELEGVEWFKSGEIPFLPVAGMHIDCGDGDLRVVRAVYWWADKPDHVEVFFEDENPRPMAYWTRGGWRCEGLSPPDSPASLTKEITS